MQFGLVPGFDLELMVQNCSSWFWFGAKGWHLELTVHSWSSWFTFGAHDFNLELMAQRVSITSFFCACYDRGFWACCDFLGMMWYGFWACSSKICIKKPKFIAPSNRTTHWPLYMQPVQGFNSSSKADLNIPCKTLQDRKAIEKT